MNFILGFICGAMFGGSIGFIAFALSNVSKYDDEDEV